MQPILPDNQPYHALFDRFISRQEDNIFKIEKNGSASGTTEERVTPITKLDLTRMMKAGIADLPICAEEVLERHEKKIQRGLFESRDFKIVDPDKASKGLKALFRGIRCLRKDNACDEELGYRLQVLRAVDLGISEKTMAHRVNQHLPKKNETVTSATVRKWEDGGSVPSEAMMEILADILIDNNPQIAKAKREDERESLIALADKAREKGPKSKAELQLRDKLKDLRNALEISEAELSERIAQCREGSLTAQNIVDVERGITKLSPAQARIYGKELGLSPVEVRKVTMSDSLQAVR